jgi:hypothetical protein
LTFLVQHVGHRHRGGLAAGARRGGHRDQRLERTRHRDTLADRLVEVVEERGGMAGEEIGGLAGVDGAAAAHRDEAVELLGARVLARLFHGAVRGLDLHAVVHLGLDALLLEERAHAVGQALRGEVAVGEDQSLGQPQPGRVEADLLHGAQAELDGRHLHHEDGSVGSVTPFMRRLP